MQHGWRHTRLYSIWANMKRRCLLPTIPNWNRYGGRGITICDEWKDNFVAFRNWALSHGYQDDLTIDRINNDGPYSPENCRWTTRQVQSRNRSTNIHTPTGQPLLELCNEDSRLHHTTIQRLRCGWPIEKALQTPIRRSPVVAGKRISVWCNELGIGSAVYNRMARHNQPFIEALVDYYRANNRDITTLPIELLDEYQTYLENKLISVEWS